jgi:hypothetical protein
VSGLGLGRQNKMIIDASRGEIQLDDLFNAIEHDKGQVAQALDSYGDYLKVKNDPTIDHATKIERLEGILRLDCIEHTQATRQTHENERQRLHLKWTVLVECAIVCRQAARHQQALDYFDQVDQFMNCCSSTFRSFIFRPFTSTVKCRRSIMKWHCAMFILVISTT